MSEEKKPEKLIIEVTMPTKESIVENIKAMIPGVSVKVVGEEEKEVVPTEEI